MKVIYMLRYIDSLFMVHYKKFSQEVPFSCIYSTDLIKVILDNVPRNWVIREISVLEIASDDNAD